LKVSEINIKTKAISGLNLFTHTASVKKESGKS